MDQRDVAPISRLKICLYVAAGFVWLAATGCGLVGETHRVLYLAKRTVEGEPSYYPYFRNDKLSRLQNRRLARQIWDEVLAADPSVGESPDFKSGFVEGFADYLYRGGSGEPPIIPPRNYWNLPFQSQRGKLAINQWYAGFRRGAEECKVRGLRELVTMPTASLLGDEFIKPAEPSSEIPSPEAPVDEPTEVPEEIIPAPLEYRTAGRPRLGRPNPHRPSPYPPAVTADQPAQPRLNSAAGDSARKLAEPELPRGEHADEQTPAPVTTDRQGVARDAEFHHDAGIDYSRDAIATDDIDAAPLQLVHDAAGDVAPVRGRAPIVPANHEQSWDLPALPLVVASETAKPRADARPQGSAGRATHPLRSRPPESAPEEPLRLVFEPSDVARTQRAPHAPIKYNPPPDFVEPFAIVAEPSMAGEQANGEPRSTAHDLQRARQLPRKIAQSGTWNDELGQPKSSAPASAEDPGGDSFQ